MLALAAWSHAAGVGIGRAGRRIGPGTVLFRRGWASPSGPVTAYVLRVDLAAPGVRVGLLYPGELAAVRTVSAMAAATGAFAAVNGDFFNIGAAGAPIGPVVAETRLIKSPEVDRTLAAGVGVDGVGRIASVSLRGSVTLPDAREPLADLNDANRGPRPILPSDGVGLFTARWGSYPLAGAVHGLSGVNEVVVRDGHVGRRRRDPSEGAIAPGTSVLLGAGSGGQALARLRPGDPVSVSYAQDTTAPVPFRFAIGGNYLLVRDGVVQPYLPAVAGESRTALGFSNGGRRLYLVATVSAHPETSGPSLTRLARFLVSLGVRDAVALDDGGSTTMVARLTWHGPLRRLSPSSGSPERPVANGIGVFSR
jgi:Phosphodiester glycosidase